MTKLVFIKDTETGIISEENVQDLINEIIQDTPIPGLEPNYICFTAEKAGAQLSVITGGAVSTQQVYFEYSYDKVNWVPLEFTQAPFEEQAIFFISDTLTFENKGDKVYFRGNNPNGTGNILPMMSGSDIENYFMTMFIGGQDNQSIEDNVFSVSGDIQTLKDKQVEIKLQYPMRNYLQQ